MAGTGTLQYMTIDDFYTNYLKENYKKLNKLEVIVVSKDIIADQRTKQNYSSVKYYSRYKNVDFAAELFPNPSVQEYLYGSSLDAYGERYKAQLQGLEQMKSLCSIVDLVVNDDYNIALVCSKLESKMYYFPYLKEYIFENFGIIMNDYSEQIKNDIKEEHNYGDFEKAKKLLQFQLQETQLIDDTLGEFFNVFTRDMANEYREVLMKKTIDELFVIGTKRGIHVNRHKPKEYIVNHILSKLIGDDESDERSSFK